MVTAGRSTESARLVGRDAARRVLLAALETAVSGRTAAVAVEGEAGAGKTVLMEWLISKATDQDMLVAAVRPVEGEADLPLAAILDVARPLARYVKGLTAEHQDVLTAASVRPTGSSSPWPLSPCSLPRPRIALS